MSGGITPKTISESEPIKEVVKVTQPIGQKNVAGDQVNPASNATAPVIYNVAMANADEECSQALPASTKRFSIHLRDYSEFRFAYETGKVAAPTEPYETIPVGHEKHEEMIEPTSLTLYFASPAAGKIAEIEAWS
ncbi:hypothetical protein ES705_14608 [subsurface metagenome]